MDPGILLGMFVHWPALGLLPALLFGLGWYRLRRGWILAASLAWLAYVPYEQAMKLRLLCSGECNIRVDLLLFYPLLMVLSASAIVVVLRHPRHTST